MRVALFGGAFDPPHVGHLLVAAYVVGTADVDQLWLMPAHRHAFDKKMAPFVHRVEMCMALASIFREGVHVTSVESEVPGKGYTVDTLEHLRRRYPSYEFRLVVGSDILEQKDAWRDFDRVEKLAPLIVIARAGHPHPRATATPAMPEVSSTEVRRRLAAGEEVSHLVPRPVLDYIRATGLYRDATI